MEDSANHLLSARLADAARLCEQRNKPWFVGFLDEYQSAYATQFAEKCGQEYMLYGGYPDATRVYIGFFPSFCSPGPDGFPVQAVCFKYRAVDRPQHRDILGALMHTGIQRDTVGDILIDDTFAIAFVCADVAKHIVAEVSTIGSAGVTASLYDGGALPQANSFLECVDTISSERLDCVVAALASCSRAAACEHISQGKVFVNGLPQEKATKRILKDDKVSIRGKGKFIIQSMEQRTKKGRVILHFKKFI